MRTHIAHFTFVLLATILAQWTFGADYNGLLYAQGYAVGAWLWGPYAPRIARFYKLCPKSEDERSA